MADITERIEKQMEGTNLALAAVAEVLQKMDGRFQKEEQASVTQQQVSAQASARAGLVKSIAKEVLTVLKGTDLGMPVAGSERKAKATGGTPQNADDSESGATIGSRTEDVQNTILAMRKEDDEEEMDDEEMKNYRKAEGDDEEADEEPADYPVEKKGYGEDEDEEDEEDEIKAMRKQLASMKKQLEASQSGMQKAIESETESRLRKMGFREELGLKAPKLTGGALGVDGSTQLIKAQAQGDTVEQLASLSYSDLRRMQYNIEMGNTDGVPRELIGG
tara:strand:- start:796 stop:1626 length:831 start_codon:yes stop_codon:yes gene_type:complete